MPRTLFVLSVTVTTAPPTGNVGGPQGVIVSATGPLDKRSECSGAAVFLRTITAQASAVGFDILCTNAGVVGEMVVLITVPDNEAVPGELHVGLVSAPTAKRVPPIMSSKA